MTVTIGPRELLVSLRGAAAALPLPARAAAARADAPDRRPDGLAGEQFGIPVTTRIVCAGAAKLGWVEGRNLRTDTRWWIPTDPESTHRFAKELVALQPDLILSQSTTTTAALLEQTRVIPIVFAVVADPIGSGFVMSLAGPGGHETGFVVLAVPPEL